MAVFWNKHKTSTSPQQDNRRRNGRWAELYAGLRMQLKGYKILERNLQTPYAEVDLLLSKANELILLEVKYRKHTPIDELVSKRQRMRLMRAAHWIHSQSPRTQFPNSLPPVKIRIDIALVRPQKKRWKLWQVHYYENAVNLSEFEDENHTMGPEKSSRFL